MKSPLPVDPHLPRIAAVLGERRAAVLVAPPGAGKTTRVPPALLEAGPAILLQPRRVAARSIARRIAEENGWRVGEEVGWQVRFERRFTKRTRLLVATEGILTARLQADPLLGDFATVILDEFHERSLHADLAIALARQAARARPDLRILVMSATLDTGPVADYLGGCPVIEIEGRAHPVEIGHADATPAEAVRGVLSRGGGHILAFLPGAPEIRRLAEELAVRPLPGDPLVLPLHGTLDAEEQDRVLAPSARRKLLLATNVAETSITVDGVTDVIDTGLHKVLRFDPGKGVDRLETERIPQDSADQRAGRAGRTGPGRALRLWGAGERLRPRREPEIRRIELSPAFLDVIAWGGNPLAFDWFEPPREEGAAAAIQLLARLGAIEERGGGGYRLTDLGDRLRRIPLHPRLARVLLASGGSEKAAAACAILSERDFWRGEVEATDSDLLARVDRIRDAPPAIQAAARELSRFTLEAVEGGEEDRIRRALLAGYPDRVAKRREPGSPRLLLATGHGAILGKESGVRRAEYLLALDLIAAPRGPGSEAYVRMASAVEREWIEPEGTERVHVFDPGSGSVRAFERVKYGAIVLEERPASPDPHRAEAILLEEWKRRGPGERDRETLARLRFAGIEADPDELLRKALAGRTSLPDRDLEASLPVRTQKDLDRFAPREILVPSGTSRRLEYREDGSVVLAVKLQELFGLGETPRIGPRGEPVTLSLLAPNGRPVQTTRDLRSFWERTYPEVRKELRGRYPKHPWPEDPWNAPPTHRTKPRK